MYKNEEPFEHTSRNGTVFKAKRSDLTGGVEVQLPKEISPGKIIADSAEMAAWHALNVRPFVSPFNGYDTVRYKIIE